ncbi:MAG TPA: Gfo/Idh/MocA family oxidoreductase [Pseudomonadales bacterium]|nr:Gfo/Idh/MocA family oxidoreductase [Pseudomonadales bacterium]
MQKVRYGIIGTGMMGCEHIRNLVMMDDVDITAIADPNEKPRRWAIKTCGERFSPTVYEDYRDLLARDDVDAVLVASPNFTHIDVMRDVFRTNKHVMLEKPMCTTLRDALEVRDAARNHPGVVWIGLEYRYMAPISTLLDHLQDVGNIRMFAIREHRYPFLKKVDDWNRFNRNTGGTLVEKCCHFFDLMNLVVGDEPIRAFASGAQDVNHLDEIYNGEVPDILDNAFVIIDYAGGTRAMLDLCMFAEGSRHEQQLAVTGDLGKIEATVPGDEMYLSRRSTNDYTTIAVTTDARVREHGFHHGASYLEHLAFIDAIRQGHGPAVSVDAGLMSVVMGLAAQQSIDTGAPVDIRRLLAQ